MRVIHLILRFYEKGERKERGKKKEEKNKLGSRSLGNSANHILFIVISFSLIVFFLRPNPILLVAHFHYSL